MHEHNFMVELCQARRKHPAMQAPFSYMVFFGHVKDFSLPNMFPPSLPPSLAPISLLSWEKWMRDKAESLYLHSLLLLYD